VLFVGVREPFHEAFLVDELYTAAAFAGIEQRLVDGSFATTYSAGVRYASLTACHGRKGTSPLR
jgi:hypothetical protein